MRQDNIQSGIALSMMYILHTRASTVVLQLHDRLTAYIVTLLQGPGVAGVRLVLRGVAQQSQ
jgi:hypothetical protein